MGNTIAQIQESQLILGLSQAEIADLFGVPPQSLAAWMTRGVPDNRCAGVETLHDLALFLDREVMRSHIPGIVHSRDAWLGNRTMLEVIAVDGVAPIRSYLSRLFAYRD